MEKEGTKDGWGEEEEELDERGLGRMDGKMEGFKGVEAILDKGKRN